ncbi:tetratricopeptide repeat protein [Gorillibacterium massiliense]|uniref:tetratricopeptide repeat protein n=1 Tax=Gorillibacterium massiliense TaxID=1280390 RepID=UPI0004B63323|nr:tetratricopeptide repeat protein [Gorillibacterium massiliense]
MDLIRAREQVEYALEIGRPEKALELSKGILQESPEEPYFLTSMAVAYLEMDLLPLAKDAVLRSLRADPDFFWSHGVYALILERDKQYWPAEEEFLTGLGMNPESTMLLSNYARFLCDRGKEMAKAEEMARKLVRITPDDDMHLVLLGRILHVSGKEEEAAAVYRQALGCNPENVEAHYYIGQTELYKNKNGKKALEHLRTALRLNPESETIRVSFFQALKAKNKLYWIFWRWSLFLSNLGKYRWAFVLVIWVAIRSLRFVADQYPGSISYIFAIVVLYIFFCLYTWTAEPVFNLFIRKGWIR